MIREVLTALGLLAGSVVGLAFSEGVGHWISGLQIGGRITNVLAVVFMLALIVKQFTGWFRAVAGASVVLAGCVAMLAIDALWWPVWRGAWVGLNVLMTCAWAGYAVNAITRQARILAWLMAGICAVGTWFAAGVTIRLSSWLTREVDPWAVTALETAEEAGLQHVEGLLVLACAVLAAIVVWRVKRAH